MHRTVAVLTLLAAGAVSAQTPGPQWTPPIRALQLLAAPVDSQERPRAVTHSDFYYTRLRVHRIGSYVILPLFVGEYFLGDKLIKENQDTPGWVKGAHSTVAGGIGVIFGVNTVTGVWNLWDSRHDPGGRARKYLHSALLIASDAGIALAAASAGDAGDDGRVDPSGARRHRNIAVGAMGIGAVGTAMMWLWK